MSVLSTRASAQKSEVTGSTPRSLRSDRVMVGAIAVLCLGLARLLPRSAREDQH